MLRFWSRKPKDDFRLLGPASRGETDAVKALLENGADINARTPLGATPLMLAAQNGHTDVVKVLVKNKAKVNERVNFSTADLLVAAAFGQDVTKLLDEDVAKTHLGATALMFAAKNGHVNVVKVLLENKTDINARTNEGKTALLFTRDSTTQPSSSVMIL